MKKSKILIFAALAAAATISVGCSNDDVVTTKDSGVPLKVTANAGDASRAQQITGSSFKYFQLYGFLGDTNNEFKNKTFTGTNQQSDWTATDDLFASNWPAENTDYTFYGVSENSASGMSTAFTNATFSNTAQTFTYTIPSDIAAQKDLLVAKATGNSSSGLTMNFEHALATTTLNISIDPSVTNIAESDGYRLHAAVKSIEFHNVYTGGTYDFSTGTWSNLTKGTYVIDLSANPLIIDSPNNAVVTKAVPLGAGEKIMFIPATVNDFWNIKANAGSDVSTTPNEGGSAYVTFEVQTLYYNAADLVVKMELLTSKNIGTTNVKYVTKISDGDAAGYYDHTGKKIASLAGEVLDLTNEIFGVEAATNDNIFGGDMLEVQIMTFAGDTEEEQQNLAIQNYFTESERAGYGIAYKPFSAAVTTKNGDNIETTLTPLTLSANKTFNLNLNIASAVQKISADGVFGSPADAGN